MYDAIWDCLQLPMSHPQLWQHTDPPIDDLWLIIVLLNMRNWSVFHSQHGVFVHQIIFIVFLKHLLAKRSVLFKNHPFLANIGGLHWTANLCILLYTIQIRLYLLFMKLLHNSNHVMVKSPFETAPPKTKHMCDVFGVCCEPLQCSFGRLRPLKWWV